MIVCDFNTQKTTKDFNVIKHYQNRLLLTKGRNT